MTDPTNGVMTRAEPENSLVCGNLFRGDPFLRFQERQCKGRHPKVAHMQNVGVRQVRKEIHQREREAMQSERRHSRFLAPRHIQLLLRVRPPHRSCTAAPANCQVPLGLPVKPLETVNREWWLDLIWMVKEFGFA